MNLDGEDSSSSSNHSFDRLKIGNLFILTGIDLENLLGKKYQEEPMKKNILPFHDKRHYQETKVVDANA